MIKAKVNGQPVQIETDYDELSFGKFLKLLECTTDTEILSVLLDIPVDTLKKAKIEGLEQIMSQLKFLSEQMEVDPKPKRVGKYDIPSDVTTQSIEQYQIIASEIQRVGGPDVPLRERTESLALYTAVYLQPIWSASSFDEEQARFLAKKLHDFPCTEVMAAGNFFMCKFVSSKTGLSMNYLRSHIRLKKWRQDSSSLTKFLVFTLPSTILRAMWERMRSKFSKSGRSASSTPN